MNVTEMLNRNIFRQHRIGSFDRPIYVIGDVHGCAEEFELLIKKIKKESPGAKIVQLGDLIDRGPYLMEVFELVEKHEIITIMGNHELNFIQEVKGMRGCYSKARRKTHDQFERLSNKDQRFILDIMYGMKTFFQVDPITIESTGVRYFPFLSHAPFDVDKVLAGKMHHMNNAWSFCAGNQASYMERPSARLISVYNFHGHQSWNYDSSFPSRRAFGNDEDLHINIDSGCVYGKKLTAMCINTGNILSVPSLQPALN